MRRHQRPSVPSGRSDQDLHQANLGKPTYPRGTAQTQREQAQLSVRELCNEKQKDHWSIIENPIAEPHETTQKTSTVDINFGFTIPKKLKARTAHRSVLLRL